MSARLESGTDSLVFEVRGYFSPDLQDPAHRDDYSANYLDVTIVGENGRDHWRMVGAYGVTWEILDLAVWLREVPDGREAEATFYGIEIYPFFELSDDRRFIEVVVQDTVTHSGEDASFGDLRFPAEPQLLGRFADELEREVANFPVRVIETDGPASQWARVP